MYINQKFINNWFSRVLFIYSPIKFELFEYRFSTGAEPHDCRSWYKHPAPHTWPQPTVGHVFLSPTETFLHRNQLFDNPWIFF